MFNSTAQRKGIAVGKANIQSPLVSYETHEITRRVQYSFNLPILSVQMYGWDSPAVAGEIDHVMVFDAFNSGFISRAII